MDSANRSVPRGTFYIGLQGAVQYVALFLAYVALTRILRPTEIGELPLLSAAYSAFSTITMFALGTATTNEERGESCRRRSDRVEDSRSALGPRVPDGGFVLSAN